MTSLQLATCCLLLLPLICHAHFGCGLEAVLLGGIAYGAAGLPILAAVPQALNALPSCSPLIVSPQRLPMEPCLPLSPAGHAHQHAHTQHEYENCAGEDANGDIERVWGTGHGWCGGLRWRGQDGRGGGWGREQSQWQNGDLRWCCQ